MISHYPGRDRPRYGPGRPAWSSTWRPTCLTPCEGCEGLRFQIHITLPGAWPAPKMYACTVCNGTGYEVNK